MMKFKRPIRSSTDKLHSSRTLLRSSIFIALTFIFSLVLFIQQGDQTMLGLFKRYQVEMSPVVRGRITDGGKPMAGMQVARSLLYAGYQNGKEQLEHTLTDTDGHFSFKPLIVKSRKPGNIFGQNMPVMQAIYVERSEHLYSLWSTSKDWKTIKPLSDLLLQLDCDLQNKKVKHQIDTEKYGGSSAQVVNSICYWQGELISTYYNNGLISSYDEI